MTKVDPRTVSVKSQGEEKCEACHSHLTKYQLIMLQSVFGLSFDECHRYQFNISSTLCVCA